MLRKKQFDIIDVVAVTALAGFFIIILTTTYDYSEFNQGLEQTVNLFADDFCQKRSCNIKVDEEFVGDECWLIPGGIEGNQTPYAIEVITEEGNFKIQTAGTVHEDAVLSITKSSGFNVTLPNNEKVECPKISIYETRNFESGRYFKDDGGWGVECRYPAGYSNAVRKYYHTEEGWIKW